MGLPFDVRTTMVLLIPFVPAGAAQQDVGRLRRGGQRRHREPCQRASQVAGEGAGVEAHDRGARAAAAAATCCYVLCALLLLLLLSVRCCAQNKTRPLLPARAARALFLFLPRRGAELRRAHVHGRSE